MAETSLTKVLDSAPLFHRLPDGRAHSHGLGREVLDFIASNVSEESATLETGAGMSTVVFALRRSVHTCITPAADEVARIQAFCQAHGVSDSRVRFVIEPSQDALPVLKGKGWDLVLIDGSHSFPIAFIDFYHAAQQLNVGGLLIIDDINLWTCNTIRSYLMEEPEWVSVAEFPRTSIFRKRAACTFGEDWPIQRFVEVRSRWFRLRNKMRMFLFLLRRGEATVLIHKLWDTVTGRSRV